MIESKKEGEEVVATPEPQGKSGRHYGGAEGESGGGEEARGIGQDDGDRTGRSSTSEAQGEGLV